MKLAYTLQELALATGLSVPHLRNEITKKRLTPTRSGRRVIILASEVDRYLGLSQTAPSDKASLDSHVAYEN